MELIKKQIHMNQWKGNAVTQITLDEDFIVPDTLEDMDQVILDNARILGENGRIQDEKMTIKGKMEFAVLYRKENGGMETLGGNIPFEEMVNVPGLKEGDDVTISWILEDMKAEMINSRKLGVQAVITVEIRAEGEENAYAASDVKMSGTEGGMIPGSSHRWCWHYTGKIPTVSGRIQLLQEEDRILPGFYGRRSILEIRR